MADIHASRDGIRRLETLYPLQLASDRLISAKPASWTRLNRAGLNSIAVREEKVVVLYDYKRRGQMLTAQEVFIETVRALPPTERLRLAALILDDLAKSNLAVIDNGNAWSEQDQSELVTLSLKHAATLYPENEELV